MIILRQLPFMLFTEIVQTWVVQRDSVNTAIIHSYSTYPTKYRQLIGNLIYLTITWPSLSYSVGLLSQFMQNPRNLHLDCAKRILRYVSATMDYDIMYKSNTTIRLEGYTDMD